MSAKIRCKTIYCDVIGAETELILHFHIWKGDGANLPKPLKEIKCTNSIKCKNVDGENCTTIKVVVDNYRKQYICQTSSVQAE